MPSQLGTGAGRQDLPMEMDLPTGSFRDANPSEGRGDVPTHSTGTPRPFQSSLALTPNLRYAQKYPHFRDTDGFSGKGKSSTSCFPKGGKNPNPITWFRLGPAHQELTCAQVMDTVPSTELGGVFQLIPGQTEQGLIPSEPSPIQQHPELKG